MDACSIASQGEKMRFVYTGIVGIVDLSSSRFETFSITNDLKEQYIGGRGFIARWLFDMVPQDIDAFDEENLLIFAGGALTGTLAPTASRLAVGALAPETNIWSIGNAGGNFGSQLKRAGWDALILKGKSPHKVYLLIQDDKIIIKSADHLWGLDSFQTVDVIRLDNRNQRLSVACIGPAGENGTLMATIMVDRVRSAGRGGLGAVMGSKNLKAVAVHGSKDIPIFDPGRFFDECLKINKRSAQLYFKSRWEKGSLGALDRYNEVGALSTRNAQQTVFEGIDGIKADTYVSDFKQPQMHACFACSIPCWSTYYIKDGPNAGFFGENVNATTFKELGARCGLANMKAILVANAMCNRLGLDTISAPAAISFAMECYQNGILSKEDCDGLELKWGDEQVMMALITQMGHGRGFGKQLAQGVKRCAEKWGKGAERFALHVKGMETTATDPRGQPSWGLGYATSSRGACHMRAYANFEYSGMTDEEMLRISDTTKIRERFEYEGKGKAVAYLENLRAIGDSIGVCHLMTRAELGFQEVLAPLYESATGINMSPENLYKAGERICNLERLSNLRFGLTPADDTLPNRYLQEPVPDGPAKGHVFPLKPMLKEYYQARDWDQVTGYPSDAKLQSLNLTHPK